jgi:hypothetical protein
MGMAVVSVSTEIYKETVETLIRWHVLALAAYTVTLQGAE